MIRRALAGLGAGTKRIGAAAGVAALVLVVTAASAKPAPKEDPARPVLAGHAPGEDTARPVLAGHAPGEDTARPVPAGPCVEACYEQKSQEYRRCRGIPPKERPERVRCFREADRALGRCLKTCK